MSTTSLILVLSVSAFIAITCAQSIGSLMDLSCEPQWFEDSYPCDGLGSPICGVDLVTYDNNCWACYFLKKKGLPRKVYGQLFCDKDYDDYMEVADKMADDGYDIGTDTHVDCSWFKRTGRLRNCHRVKDEVCGKSIITDTFHNPCYLCKHANWYGVEPEILHKGACTEAEIDRHFFDKIGWSCKADSSVWSVFAQSARQT